MKHSRVLAFITILIILVGLLSMTALASGETTSSSTSSDPDIFAAAGSIASAFQSKVLGISSAVAAAVSIVALAFWGFGDERKSAQGLAWFKRIVVAYILINGISIVFSTIRTIASSGGISF